MSSIKSVRDVAYGRSSGGSGGSTGTRESRIALRFTIEICGFDRFGKFFSERSETTNVSRHGCKFRVHTELVPETVVAIRVIRARQPGMPSAPSLFQVARTEPHREGWSAGAAILQQSDVWSVDFAALDSVPKTID
jgi:hypothetical protein